MIKGFPNDISSIRATLLRALALKGFEHERFLVERGTISLRHEEHDNWDGGIDGWRIHISIPLDLFFKYEELIPACEKNILSAAETLLRGDNRNYLTGITLSPAEIATLDPGVIAPERLAEAKFWKEKRFRLFISHCSTHKTEAKALSDALELYGISGFVAHEDIKPTALWQAEIEKALDTMDALAGLLTQDFTASLWCDQEIGIAIGKSRLVIPVRLGADPYGFMGKYQGIAGGGKTIPELAREIANVLLSHDLTKEKMSQALINKFINSNSYDTSKNLIVLLEGLPAISADQAKAIGYAMDKNGEIRDAFGVRSRVKNLLRKHGHEKYIAPEPEAEW